MFRGEAGHVASVTVTRPAVHGGWTPLQRGDQYALAGRVDRRSSRTDPVANRTGPRPGRAASVADRTNPGPDRPGWPTWNGGWVRTRRTRPDRRPRTPRGTRNPPSRGRRSSGQVASPASSPAIPGCPIPCPTHPTRSCRSNRKPPGAAAARWTVRHRRSPNGGRSSVPPVTAPVITEHQLLAKTCGCGTVTTADWADADDPNATGLNRTCMTASTLSGQTSAGQIGRASSSRHGAGRMAVGWCESPCRRIGSTREGLDQAWRCGCASLSLPCPDRRVSSEPPTASSNT